MCLEKSRYAVLKVAPVFYFWTQLILKLIAPFLWQLKKDVLVQIEPEMTGHWKAQQGGEKDS